MKNNEHLMDIIEKIDIKAEAGLCYFTLESARCFLKDIRTLVNEARSTLNVLEDYIEINTVEVDNE